ncbi:hypothetical protein BH09SUM1_BH09SUM1_30100 [soil metagenome]
MKEKPGSFSWRTAISSKREREVAIQVKRRSWNYHEGEWYSVPLGTGGFGAVLIAYRNQKQKYLFVGYFYGPRSGEPPALDVCAQREPGEALLISKCSALAIKEGEWMLIGQHPEWRDGLWPLPHFVRNPSDLTPHSPPLCIVYDPRVSLAEPVEETPCTKEEASLLPEDVFAGSLWASEGLNILISSKENAMTAAEFIKSDKYMPTKIPMPVEVGNFDNDGARDFLSDFIDGLSAKIDGFFVKGEAALDEKGEAELMPSVSLIHLVCKTYKGVPPPVEKIEGWKEKYLAIFDAQISALDPVKGYATKRRKVIINTFDRLLELE